MDDKTKGAWVVHHMQKLAAVMSTGDFDNIIIAGKAGVLLSSLSRSEQVTIAEEQVRAFAKAAGISALELPTVLDHLEGRKLISQGAGSVETLGITSATVLTHTGQSFTSLKPTGAEDAVITLAEKVSVLPVARKLALEEVGDTHRLSKTQLKDLARQVEEIGFVDATEGKDGDPLYFNGHLFRRDTTDKIAAVISSLTEEDNRKIREVDALLSTKACVPLDDVVAILGTPLFGKLHHIGMYDVSGVHNQTENVLFVTRPAAFGKYGDPFVDDALDLAKCFVACLTYGMTRSSAGRGRIAMIKTLLRKLIAGNEIGPATAIGEDYLALEMKGVIQTRPEQEGGRLFFMRLLKRDVGELALHVIAEGEATQATVLGTAPIKTYTGPETQRVRRKKQNQPSEKETRDLLNAIRSGGR